MIVRTLIVIAGIALWTSVWAHEGVKNPAVMARMNNMTEIADNMKIVGKMAKGETSFDAEVAQSALVAVSEEAAEIPGLFEAQEDDAKSEALPEIWETFGDFTQEAIELEKLAAEFSTAITSRDDLRSALFVLGQSCTSCHEAYRK